MCTILLMFFSYCLFFGYTILARWQIWCNYYYDTHFDTINSSWLKKLVCCSLFSDQVLVKWSWVSMQARWATKLRIWKEIQETINWRRIQLQSVRTTCGTQHEAAVCALLSHLHFTEKLWFTNCSLKYSLKDEISEQCKVT